MIMNYPKHKIILIAIFGPMALLDLIYFVIFGRALGQQENHIGIALALPKVILTSEVVRVDDETYLTKNRTSFVKAMEQQGFTYVEQMGLGHFFTKDGKNYPSMGRMYSSYFMLFSHPQPMEN